MRAFYPPISDYMVHCLPRYINHVSGLGTGYERWFTTLPSEYKKYIKNISHCFKELRPQRLIPSKMSQHRSSKEGKSKNISLIEAFTIIVMYHWGFGDHYVLNTLAVKFKCSCRGLQSTLHPLCPIPKLRVAESGYSPQHQKELARTLATAGAPYVQVHEFVLCKVHTLPWYNYYLFQ